MKHAALLAVMLLVLSGTAHAHRVNVFCVNEGDALTGEGYYASGEPAIDAPVKVYEEKTGKLAAEGRTDGEGRFSIELAGVPPKDLRVELEAGMGHKAVWRLSAEASSVASYAASSRTSSDTRTSPNPPASAARPARTGGEFFRAALGIAMIWAVFWGIRKVRRCTLKTSR
ncbi:MAG: hypothetical protein HQL11_03700 [Candidatus Omnitrophica bacterium]|nr:hypothetical protein [Candidatus Omnitrophota bacterium]